MTSDLEELTQNVEFSYYANKPGYKSRYSSAARYQRLRDDYRAYLAHGGDPHRWPDLERQFGRDTV